MILILWESGQDAWGGQPSTVSDFTQGGDGASRAVSH